MTSTTEKLRHRFRHRGTSIAALIAATSAVAAFAQPALAQVSADDAETETAVEDAEATLGKIIVTATKRHRPAGYADIDFGR